MNDRSRQSMHLLIGVILVFAGLALLMDNQGLISVGPLWRYWPLAILAVGIIKVAFARSRAEQGNGLWLMVIGFWLAVSVLHWWDLSFEETWPAVFIAFGISTLWKGLPRKSTPQSLEG